MSNQICSHILMVRPANFGFNEQTAESNAFQMDDKGLKRQEIRNNAVNEFDDMVRKLRAADINVHVVQDTNFPINQMPFFQTIGFLSMTMGRLLLTQSFSTNRQAEIREDILEGIGDKFFIKKRIRFNRFAEQKMYLEGTGSMVLDRENRIVYACVSDRTEENLLHNFAEWAGYEPILFLAVDSNGLEIYHTNVMMGSWRNLRSNMFWILLRKKLIELKFEQKLESTKKKIIDISYDQMLSFAGNMLQVSNNAGKTFLVMSHQAYKSLNNRQIEAINNHTNILTCQIDTIEKYGGGSARCMMAEVFLPVRN